MIESERDRTLWPDPEHGPWRLEAVYSPTSTGRWELVGLRIEPVEDVPPVPLTTTVLRKLVPSRMIAQHRRGQRRWNEAFLNAAAGGDNPKVREWLTAASSTRDADVARVGRPPVYHGERLAEMAQIYSAAWMRRENPTSAVAAHFHISRSHAGKLVARCRRQGLLPPTEVGKARGTSQ